MTQSDTARPWRRLPDAVRRVWMLRSLIMDLCVMAVCGLAAVVFHVIRWWSWCHALALTSIVVLAALELAAQPLRTRYAYRFNRYSIGEHDVMLHRGWLFRTTTTIPYNRVQHVETRQGPLLRRFGLTAVEIHTAVSEHEIPALENVQAAAIVEQISARVLASRDDV